MTTMKKWVPRYDADDVLELVGLERRRPLMAAILPAIGLLALGAAVGAGFGLMLAPSSGRRLRKDVGDRFDQLREKMMRDAARARGELQKKEAQVAGAVNATQQ
jgi:hypothetical protein